jgi:hypothetical protein
MDQDGWFLQETIPWYVKKVFQTTVIRNRDWYAETLAKQEEFWKRVEDAQKGLIELPQPKKRSEKVIVNVCKIVGDFVEAPTLVPESSGDLAVVSNDVVSTPVETPRSTE